MLSDKEHLLLLLKEKLSLTQIELAEMMDKSRRTIQGINKCLIERIGSKKTDSWIVKKVDG